MVVVVPPVCDHLSFSQLCFAALAACLMFAGQASADVTVSSTEPTTDIPLDQFHFGGTSATNGRIRTNIGPNGRGSFFSLDTSPLTGSFAIGDSSVSAAGNFIIEGITIQRDADAITADSIDVVFFSGTPNDDFSGSAATAANFITDTGITVLSNTNILTPTLEADSSDGDFLTFDVNPLTVNSSDALGFVLIANGGTIGHFEGNNAGGGRTQFNGAELAGPSGSRDFNFLITGQAAVPEPSSLLGLMGLAGLLAVKRRR